METKICCKCTEILPINMFDNIKHGEKIYIRNKCKNCRIIETQELRKKNKEKPKKEITHKICIKCQINLEVLHFNKYSLSSDGYHKICRKCLKITRQKKKQDIEIKHVEIYCIKCKTTKSNIEFRTNARSSTGYYKTCNLCWKPCEWNKEKQKESERKYIRNNPDKIREKYKRDSKKPQRIIKSRLSLRIRHILQYQGKRKSNKTIDYIGCTTEFLKKWFEFQFTENINWNNIDEWHIDHVIPCMAFDLTNEKEQKECFNWKNLRPCLAKDNLEKNSKIINSIINKQKELVTKFLEINPLPTYPGNRGEGTD